MTWGDVKLAALQTMYSNEGAVLTEDDITEVETLAQAYYDALDAEDKANAEEITQ